MGSFHKNVRNMHQNNLPMYTTKNLAPVKDIFVEYLMYR